MSTSMAVAGGGVRVHLAAEALSRSRPLDFRGDLRSLCASANQVEAGGNDGRRADVG